MMVCNKIPIHYRLLVIDLLFSFDRLVCLFCVRFSFQFRSNWQLNPVFRLLVWYLVSLCTRISRKKECLVQL